MPAKSGPVAQIGKLMDFGLAGGSASSLAKANAKFGDATLGMLNAMSGYWDALSALAVRQEHGALKDGDPLDWDDARAVVFQTLFVMYELDRNLV